MPIFEQIPIRLALSTVSNPPVTPLDYNTGRTPKFWRSQTVAIAVGVFDAQGVPADLQNIASIQLILQKSQASLVPLAVKTITAPGDGDFSTQITTAGWQNATQQNALFVLDAADTDQALEGQSEANFWIVVRGVTEEGAPLIFGAGPVVIYNASSSLPLGPTNYVSRNEQDSDEPTDVTITPTSQQHTEVLTVSGDAGTRNVLLGNSGVVAGAVIMALVYLPETSAEDEIVLNFKSVDAGNPTIFTANTTGGVTRALFKFSFDGANWTPLEATQPAY